MRPHSEAAAAAAVQLVREGKAEALMKGSLHTDELMAAVVKRDTGLRTARRVSHCFVMDVPGHDDALIITDAAINIAPTLEDKVDIVQNAIDLAHAMGIAGSASGHPLGDGDRQPEGAFHHRGGGAVQDDGPRTRSPARSSTARWRSTTPSASKRRRSRRSIRRWRAAPTCWWCPTSKRATCSPRACRFLAGADAAGIVLGARVPIILTSRADSVLTRLASCAVAVMVAQARREAAKAVE